MLSSTSPVLEYQDHQFKLTRTGSHLSASNRSSTSSSSSRPNIPFKPGHLRSISSQVRVQNRIIQAVQIPHECLDSAISQISATSPPVLQHVDQSTIKATHRRPPRESVNAIQKLMQSDNHAVNPPVPREWSGRADKKSVASVDQHPSLLEPKRHVGPSQAPKKADPRKDGKEKLSLGIKSDQPVVSSSETQGVTGHTYGQASSFTPLITPHQAIALHCFNPEAYDSSESGKEEEDGSDKMTPEVGFKSGDLLEIWVPDIGGGWSLGKNLTNCAKSQLDPFLIQNDGTKVNDWGLIPIGWYKIIDSSNQDTPRRFKKLHHKKSVHTPRLTTGTQQPDSDSFFPHSQARLRSSHDNDRMVREHSPSTSYESSDLEVYPQNRKKIEETSTSSVKRRAVKSHHATELSIMSSRGSSYFLSPPISNASVAVNKEFDPHGIHFDYQARGIACSVTASDAMFAARQASDRHLIDPLVPGGSPMSQTPKGSSWNPFHKNRVTNRRQSIAHSYIMGQEEDGEQYLSTHEDQDQASTERYEIRAGPAWKDSAPRFTIQVHSPKLQAHPTSKIKAHVIYNVTSTFPDDKSTSDDASMNVQVTVNRRYSHFELLSIGLNSIYGEVIDLPTLPEKRFTNHHDGSFIENRRRALERYLFRLTRHPVLRYCPRLTTFLGSEDVEEFEQEARTWTKAHPEPPQNAGGQSQESVASSSFFSKVFHPDYNVDEPEVELSIEAYSRHTHSFESGKSMVDLERNVGNLRISMQDMSQNFQKMSSTIQRLCSGLPLTHRPLPFDRQKKYGISVRDELGYVSTDDVHQKRQKEVTQGNQLLNDLRRDARDAGLQNSDGAMCWKEDCTECLAMTKALQLLGQSLGNVAQTYSTCASEALGPVGTLVKELSFPHKNRKILSSLHDSTKVSFSELSGYGHNANIFESRKETVLNVVMSEIERHHQERNLDFREMAKTLLDSQIQLHKTACEQLEEARKALEEPQLSFLGCSGPRSMNAEEAKSIQAEDLTRSNSAIFASSHTESYKTARSQVDRNRAEEDRPISRSSSVLEWINRSATYSGKLPQSSPSSSPLNNNIHLFHTRNPSIGSHSSTTVASSAFSSVFVKPLSAAFSSMVDLSDYLS
ncbi:hypothetical protein PSTG_06559 [Puccinia striiformis f. sp. tritici PST-78]|uniref:PX domain-containing protein n=2 Tax=Puccinia striiformis f. sp. tritici PST-78 TaxID=1165861 RepID=A0A0L0VLK1_9BASI|nr:hypothetical protein PSTG_06559 [Puccinia striiformis f. sp. tritici PST-78]